MALATRCPSCTTVFRISTAQAAAKSGMVRCGICRHVFNSLDALVRVEDLDVVEEVIVDPSHGEAQTETAVHVTADVASSYEVAASVDAASPTVDDASARAEPSFRNEHAVVSEWWLPDTAAGPTGASGLVDGDRTSRVPSSSVSGPRGELASEPSSTEGTNPVFMRPEPEAERASRAMRWTLAALSLIAATALLAQATYLLRDEIAVRWPPSRPWPAAACGALRCRIDYPIHAESITIESAMVQTTGAGSNVYVMTALLRNRDAIDLQYPHLELVLTDLRDQPIVRRDLRPEDYLAPGRSPSSGFAAQSEEPVRVAFELAGMRFAGYRINQSYP